MELGRSDSSTGGQIEDERECDSGGRRPLPGVPVSLPVLPQDIDIHLRRRCQFLAHSLGSLPLGPIQWVRYGRTDGSTMSG